MVTSQEIYAKARVGIGAGCIGGLLVLVPFAAISSIGFHLSPWAFHTMIGVALGLHGLQATLFGFIAHMFTAITIGAVFCMCSTLHPMLYLNRLWKGILGGAVTGLEVYAIFFMPITLFMILPALSLTPEGANSSIVTQERQMIAVMKANLPEILWGALMLHILFGILVGIYSTLFLSEKFPRQKNESLKESRFPS